MQKQVEKRVFIQTPLSSKNRREVLVPRSIEINWNGLVQPGVLFVFTASGRNSPSSLKDKILKCPPPKPETRNLAKLSSVVDQGK